MYVQLNVGDVRNPKVALGTAENITCFHEEANTIFSPNEKYVLAGFIILTKELHLLPKLDRVDCYVLIRLRWIWLMIWRQRPLVFD